MAHDPDTDASAQPAPSGATAPAAPELPPQSPPPSTPRSPVWMRVALAVSLAANMAIAGVVIGAVFHDRDGRAEAASRTAGLGLWGPAFDRDDRAALRRAYDRDGPARSAPPRADRADRVALVAALRADPFDPAAIEAINARLLARSQERGAHGMALVGAHVAGLDRARRLIMADRLEARLTRAGGKPERD